MRISYKLRKCRYILNSCDISEGFIYLKFSFMVPFGSWDMPLWIETTFIKIHTCVYQWYSKHVLSMMLFNNTDISINSCRSWSVSKSTVNHTSRFLCTQSHFCLRLGYVSTTHNMIGYVSTTHNIMHVLYQPGMVILEPMWVRLALNGTNPRLIQIRF